MDVFIVMIHRGMGEIGGIYLTAQAAQDSMSDYHETGYAIVKGVVDMPTIVPVPRVEVKKVTPHQPAAVNKK